MTDPSQPNSQVPPDDLGDEFRNLGNNLKNFFQTAWKVPRERNSSRKLRPVLTKLANH